MASALDDGNEVSEKGNISFVVPKVPSVKALVPDKGADDVNEATIPNNGADDVTTARVPDKGADDVNEATIPNNGADDVTTARVPDKGADDVNEATIPNNGADDVTTARVPDKGADDMIKVHHEGADELMGESVAVNRVDNVSEAIIPVKGEDEVIEELICPICLDTYRNPRTLMGCLHTFCELCLIEYVSIVEKDSDRANFQCPICRIPAKGPVSKSKITEWVQNLPVNHVINSLIGKNIKKLVDYEEIRYSCAPCLSQETEKEAWHFCVECDENLCRECVGYHRHLKLTRNHNIVSYAEVGNDPKQAINLTMSLKCDKHPEKEIEFFCKDENMLFCISCATVRHRACAQVCEISQLEDGLDDSVNALTTMKDLKQSSELVNEITRKNDEALKQDLRIVRKDFQQFKNDMMQKLNTIECQIKKKCTALELGSESVNTDILARNNGVSSAIGASIKQLENILTHGNSVQKFVAVHRTPDQIKEYKKVLDTNFQNLKSQEVSLDLRTISLLFLQSDRLADVKVKEQALGVMYSLDKLKRCQNNVYLMKLKWTRMKLLKIQNDIRSKKIQQYVKQKLSTMDKIAMEITFLKQ